MSGWVTGLGMLMMVPGINVNVCSDHEDGYTPLIASVHGWTNLSVLDMLLLDPMIDVNIPSNDGRTALMCAIEPEEGKANHRVVTKLMKNKSNLFYSF